ncbi:intradiol ring-cleavage dioxygenase [Nodosilinea sp. LEGE 06152]|uniref:intradiol ring-cleavage dioxygenase n=1 Tax=Nodosilinea sp. LEGE 06152 TaxID=2777966 RepID=UPI00187ED5D2|nr:intradiol ring-cleavage dioxygenase [Nodosilinea sp. LEGE 06152]MBE9158080.1 intradiol ring-cleavage dioxygenase [Nodosilinea sp. LEGE 06152]
MNGPRFNRRDALGLIGGSLIVSLLGCARRPSASAELSGTVAQTSTGAAGQPACTVRPQQTEGPYFVDEGLNRSDIRSDPATGSVTPGVPLTLQFRVSQVGANACVPLAGAIVDVWHCDANGVYSDVVDPRANTVGQKFLRGSQTTNADGTVEFTTIYPGWYPGRAVHIHFKIRDNTAANQSYEFTSQLYFDDALSDRIYAQPPYSTRGDSGTDRFANRTTRNQNDGIFRNGGDRLMLPVTETGEGYTGRFEIGLEVA